VLALPQLNAIFRQLTDTQLRPAQILQDSDRAAKLRFQIANQGDALAMPSVRAVGKVQPRNVHTRVSQLQ
jgi:hypothetical protein